MYEIFVKLLEKYGVTAYKVSKATGIGGSTFTDWKNGRSVPKQDKLQKIADYFGVTIDYLMTGKEEPEKKRNHANPKGRARHKKGPRFTYGKAQKSRKWPCCIRWKGYSRS